MSRCLSKKVGTLWQRAYCWHQWSLFTHPPTHPTHPTYAPLNTSKVSNSASQARRIDTAVLLKPHWGKSLEPFINKTILFALIRPSIVAVATARSASASPGAMDMARRVEEGVGKLEGEGRKPLVAWRARATRRRRKARMSFVLDWGGGGVSG